MKKFATLLAAVVVVKLKLIGMSNYLPIGEEAKQVLKDTQGLWACDQGTTPVLVLQDGGLFVECKKKQP